MKTLFSLSFCCFLFVLPGLMTSCGKPTLKQEPAEIPAKPAVEKRVEAPEKPQAGKPVAKPEASAVTAPKKAPVAEPTIPKVEKPAEQPVASKPVASPDKAQAEKPNAKPEASAVTAPKKEPVAEPTKPKVEKLAEQPVASNPVAAPDKAQLEQAAKAIVEAARSEAEKKNAPKPKVLQAVEYLPVVEVTVKQHTYFEYNTGMSGDEQGAKFKSYAKHAKYSNILRDKTTGFEVIYRYRSKPDYVGKDSVELEYSDHQLGSGPDDPGTTTITRQVINITVVANEKK
jgi:hypothetical protein